MSRPRRFNDTLCLTCRVRPQAPRAGGPTLADGSPAMDSYCRTCRNEHRKAHREKTKIRGHEHWAWKRGGAS